MVTFTERDSMLSLGRVGHRIYVTEHFALQCILNVFQVELNNLSFIIKSFIYLSAVVKVCVMFDYHACSSIITVYGLTCIHIFTGQAHQGMGGDYTSFAGVSDRPEIALRNICSANALDVKFDEFSSGQVGMKKQADVGALISVL